MNGNLNQLENAVEQQLSLLRGWAAPRISEAALARIQLAVATEAGGARRAGAWLGWSRRCGAVAAGLLLALGLTWTGAGVRTDILLARGSAETGAPLAQGLDEYATALERSTAAVQSLVSYDWLLSPERGEPGEPDYDDWLRALESVERIGV